MTNHNNTPQEQPVWDTPGHYGLLRLPHQSTEEMERFMTKVIAAPIPADKSSADYKIAQHPEAIKGPAPEDLPPIS
jgi:hypothetical protein